MIDSNYKHRTVKVLFLCDQQGLPCSKEHNRYCGNDICTHCLSITHAKNRDIFEKDPESFLSDHCVSCVTDNNIIFEEVENV